MPPILDLTAEFAELEKSGGFLSADIVKSSDRTAAAKIAKGLAANVFRIVRKSRPSSSGEAKAAVRPVGEAMASVLNKSAALDRVFNPPPRPRENATDRLPLIAAVYGKNGPLYFNDAYVRATGVGARELRDAYRAAGIKAAETVLSQNRNAHESSLRAAYAKAGTKAINGLLFGLDTESETRANALVGNLPRLKYYRSEFGPYVSGRSLRSYTNLLEVHPVDAAEGNPGTPQGSVRLLVDAGTPTEPPVESAYDEFFPGDLGDGRFFQGDELGMHADLKELKRQLTALAGFRGDRNEDEHAASVAMLELTTLAAVTDILWGNGPYLMRMEDHKGFRANAAMAASFGRDADGLRAMIADGTYGKHYYGSGSADAGMVVERADGRQINVEEELLRATQIQFDREGWYFNRFETRTDLLGKSGKRRHKMISWDRYAAHAQDEREDILKLDALGLTADEAQRVAKAEIRVGLEEAMS